MRLLATTTLLFSANPASSTNPGHAPDVKLLKPWIYDALNAGRLLCRRLHPAFGSGEGKRRLHRLVELETGGTLVRRLITREPLSADAVGRMFRVHGPGVSDDEYHSAIYVFPVSEGRQKELSAADAGLARAMLSALDFRAVWQQVWETRHRWQALDGTTRWATALFVDERTGELKEDLHGHVFTREERERLEQTLSTDLTCRINVRMQVDPLTYLTKPIRISWDPANQQASLLFRDFERQEGGAELWLPGRVWQVDLATGQATSEGESVRLSNRASEQLAAFNPASAVFEVERYVNPAEPTSLERALELASGERVAITDESLLRPPVRLRDEHTRAPPSARSLEVSVYGPGRLGQDAPDEATMLGLKQTRAEARRWLDPEHGPPRQSATVIMRGAEPARRIELQSRLLEGTPLENPVVLVHSPGPETAFAFAWASPYSRDERASLRDRNRHVAEVLGQQTDCQTLAFIGRVPRYIARFPGHPEAEFSELAIEPDSRRIVNPYTGAALSAAEDEEVKASLCRQLHCTIRVRVPKTRRRELEQMQDRPDDSWLAFEQHGARLNLLFEQWLNRPPRAEVLLSDRTALPPERNVILKDRSLPKIRVTFESGYALGNAYSPKRFSRRGSPFFFKLDERSERALEVGDPWTIAQVLEDPGVRGIEVGFLNAPSLFPEAVRRYLRLGPSADVRLPEDIGFAPVRWPWEMQEE